MTSPFEISCPTLPTAPWPFVPVLGRLSLAIAIGVFIGLERELNGKVGVRTFALTALLGCLAGLVGHPLPAIVLALVALFILIMNWREWSVRAKLVMTTSVALPIVALCGVLCGQGHLFTPVAAGVFAAALLAWKKPLTGFAHGITEKEVRAAVLLAILSVIVLPVLPDHPVDPWGLIDPRSNWISVVIIAGLGFVNYILMRLLGPRGMEITAFFGGLVNSRKVVVELVTRVRESGAALLPVAYRGLLLATGAMALRNALIVAMLARAAAPRCAVPMGLMLLASGLLWKLHPAPVRADGARALALESPFSLSAALQFGAVFLVLNVLGALAQRYAGAASFYFVSALGGLLSSGSSIASAATLINHGEISVRTGVNGIVISSVVSILINIPLVSRLAAPAGFRRRLMLALGLIGLAGCAGIAVSARL
jgi:uncharacterized membrane protein (DUF4010 family)